MITKQAYNVVKDKKGYCKSCEAGSTWTVEGPDGVCLGTSYEDKEFAEEIAELMNEAYKLGVDSYAGVK